MRERTRTDNEVPSTLSRQGYCWITTGNPLCPVTDKVDSYTKSRDYEAMFDVNNLDFAKLSAEGKIICSPMYQEKYTWKLDPTHGSIIWYQNGIPSERSSISWVTDLPITPILKRDDPGSAISDFLYPYESERSIALTKAWANVDESELLALASMGELPETLEWIVSLYRRGIGICKLFKAKRVKLAITQAVGNKDSISYADDVLNFWMEFRYAVRPLIFEMEQIIAAIESQAKPLRHTARGFHSVEESDTTTEEQYHANSTYSNTVALTVSRESNYRAGVLYQIGLTHNNWTEILGFDKPLESIYELTKLSFVLDWFFNVGDLLSSFTTSSNLTPLASWCVEDHVFKTMRGSTDINIHNISSPYSYSLESSYYGTLVETHHVKRRVISPSRAWYPSIKINLDWKKVVDLAAIARSIYRAF